jgi:hypothetical protein
METYRWSTIEYHATNETTMQDYLENHLLHEFWTVFFEDGSYAEIQNKYDGKIWGVNAYGDGDSFHHKVEFKQITK